MPDSFAILFFTTSDLTFTTRHIHNWMFFLLWLNHFISFGAISPLFSSSILERGVHLSDSYILVFSYCSQGSQNKNDEMVCHSLSSGPCLSECSTMTCPSWVALHGLAPSFTELDKAVILVISLVSFL